MTGRLGRFKLAIQAYDLKIEHRSGKSNNFCDYLSRWPPAVYSVEQETVDLTLLELNAPRVVLDELVMEQKKDSLYAVSSKSLGDNPTGESQPNSPQIPAFQRCSVRRIPEKPRKLSNIRTKDAYKSLNAGVSRIPFVRRTFRARTDISAPGPAILVAQNESRRSRLC
ncbi:unnamed protein product [Bursaphelenchus xylophilus]|uniref:(pine wood nematode) hypothetical protein n=1 Tax=Bursaphelenchus xylophilus TaxID=6326 RepID=A0A1I7RM90_BURXY|nr:unnamed protein product [Bursaphelenchus xylophilus]CAG9118306.1 unnamed protein product [Bursaphelenchus xylophilus]